MQDLSPAFIQLHPLGVLATISLIQAGIQQQPEIADREFAKIGIAAARQLQKDLFNQYSETYKVLELGWNPEAYILTPSGELDDKVCDEPCDKFLQNLGCRCTGYKAEKLIFASDQQIPSETLTAGATASISQVVSSGQV